MPLFAAAAVGRDLDDKFEAAEKFRHLQEWKGTLVVDGMDNAAQKAFGSFPGEHM